MLLARALAVAGDTEAAAEAYEASLPDLRAGGNLFAVGRAVADLAAIAIARGDADGGRPAVRVRDRGTGRGGGGELQPCGLGRPRPGA